MSNKSVRAAATKLMKRLNRAYKSPYREAATHNRCWNAATKAYGYAAEGQTAKAQRALTEARACARNLR